MSDKFQNKYRIPSARIQTWDYASEGMYFVTICTKNRKYYFGDVVDRKMQLSECEMVDRPFLTVVNADWIVVRPLFGVYYKYHFGII